MVGMGVLGRAVWAMLAVDGVGALVGPDSEGK